MANKVILRKLNDSTQEKCNSFWRWYITWISQEDVRNNYFGKEYLKNTTSDFWKNIDFYNTQYILYYEKEFPVLQISNRGVYEEEIKDILEITYNKWILSEKQDEFACEVNTHLKKGKFFYQIGKGEYGDISIDKKKDIFVCVEFVQDPNVRRELLTDILTILMLMQANRIYRGVAENSLNDGVRDGLKITRRYQVHDQTRRGESESGKGVGELDILVTTKQEDL